MIRNDDDLKRRVPLNVALSIEHVHVRGGPANITLSVAQLNIDPNADHLAP
jgi:hypothetical protein